MKRSFGRAYEKNAYHKNILEIMFKNKPIVETRRLVMYLFD